MTLYFVIDPSHGYDESSVIVTAEHAPQAKRLAFETITGSRVEQVDMSVASEIIKDLEAYVMDNDGYRHLGFANGWGSKKPYLMTVHEFECEKGCTHLDYNRERCLSHYTCDECKIKWSVDSSG